MRKCQLEEVLADRLAIPKILKEIKISLECEHGRNKHLCKDCGGKTFCKHNRQKYQCKDCGGNFFCEHNRLKFQCKDCGGKAICQHYRQRHQCKDCLIEKYSDWKK